MVARRSYGGTRLAIRVVSLTRQEHGQTICLRARQVPRVREIHLRDQNPGRDARHIDSRWRHAGLEMAPYCGPKTERAEQDEDAAGDDDQPLGDKSRK